MLVLVLLPVVNACISTNHGTDWRITNEAQSKTNELAYNVCTKNGAIATMNEFT